MTTTTTTPTSPMHDTSATLTSSSLSSFHFLLKKAALVVILAVALYTLHDNHGGFSVWKALERHEPSARIFRSLLEVNLILFGTAFSIHVWSQSIGITVVRRLLFQPVTTLLTTTTTSHHHHHAVGAEHDDDDDSGSDHHDGIVHTYNDNDDEHGGGGGGIHARHRIIGQHEDDHKHGTSTIERETHPDTTTNASIPEKSHIIKDVPIMDADTNDLDRHDVSHDDDDDDIDISHGDGLHIITPTGAPSAQSVLSASLDVLLVILLLLFFFTWTAAVGWQQEAKTITITTTDHDVTTTMDHYPSVFSRIAAPIFPLVLFLYLAAVLLVRQRRQFWLVLSLTVTAPWHPVTFRDGFVGDILTSSVRPLQDISFTLVYLCYGLQGWWSENYYYASSSGQPQQQVPDGLVPVWNSTAAATTNWTASTASSSSFSQSFVHQADAQVPAMEKSWILHTILLPLCMISPLWWRFLQNLRQTHDARQRWPFLGNALKYFCAAQVAVFGVFYPEETKHSTLWLASFVLATLYQIWWDVFMDWGLLEKTTRNLRASSSSWSAWLPSWCLWQLRKDRLYKRTALYWVIAIVNVLLRFCWTLSFVPTRYLNATGVLTENFAGDVSSILSPTIASAEIIRRTLWGLLRFEYEAIRVGGFSKSKSKASGAVLAHSKSDRVEEDDGVELVPMKMHSSGENNRSGNEFGLGSRISSSMDMASMTEMGMLAELCTYATVFAVLGLVAAAHRGTL